MAAHAGRSHKQDYRPTIAPLVKMANLMEHCDAEVRPFTVDADHEDRVITMSCQHPAHDEKSGSPTSPGPARDWRTKAACLYEDPELFFPIGTTGKALERVAEAKAICQGCPVITQCLEWALEHNELGVWGGKSEDERQRMHRRRRQKGERSKPQHDGL